MRRLTHRLLAAAVGIGSTALLVSCETTPLSSSSRHLPAYETPIAKADFQTVRTTAYTHTEADHTQYTNHNALGTTLKAATPGLQLAARTSSSSSIESYLTPQKRKVISWVKTRHGRKKVVRTETVRPIIGSAAADWSRWPAGTTFRLLSTGQIYKIDDYGWALSGRNTIDLYMANRASMNSWGLRDERIQILRWGDAQTSIRVLEGRQRYKHLKRMMLELQGQEQAAASLQ